MSYELQRLRNTIEYGMADLTKNLVAIEKAIKESKQTKQGILAKSGALPFLSAGFFLLVSAAGAYYYREKIKQACSSNAQTQTNFSAAPTIERADAASQTEEQPAATASITSTETPSSNALPTTTQTGFFSTTTTRSPSPIDISLQNTPINTSNAQTTGTTTEQGGWFSALTWGRR